MDVKITVKCIGCGKIKEVGSEQTDMPMCTVCGNPMIAQRAEIK